VERTAEAGAWQVGGAVDGWWDRERAEFLISRLAPRLRRARLVADVGCGWGSFTDRMAAETSGFTVGCDFKAYPTWKNLPGRLAYVVGDARRLPFRSGAFDIAVALDVIEHFADDQGPLGELRRLTRSDGAVGLAVPALPKLWSRFDESVGHHRRYLPDGLDRACHSAGLRSSELTYFFAWLVVPAWLMRKRDRRNADRTRPGLAGRVLDRAVTAACGVERAWLRRRRLPIGTSLWSLSVPAGMTPDLTHTDRTDPA
jgi:SAM-dependent methyltransferase